MEYCYRCGKDALNFSANPSMPESIEIKSVHYAAYRAHDKKQTFVTASYFSTARLNCLVSIQK
jgi:hypothetical protein